MEQQIRKNSDALSVILPIYDFLVYLRHHGFPSPLLDWTESPYIAAYFAYLGAEKANPAVYCYIETPNLFKSWDGSKPIISLQGPFVTAHKRHFTQRAWYTIATHWDNKSKDHYFCHHEKVFDAQEDPYQDLLIRIELPVRDRKVALQKLFEYNINHFTLFQSEDSLIKALETRRFDL